MKKYLLIPFVLLFFYSCKNNAEEKQNLEIAVGESDAIADLNWLLGTWTNEDGAAFSQETWSKENDSTFTAYSFVEQAGEVVFAETMVLEQRANGLVLTVATADQKDEKPVPFKFISSAAGKIIFENKNHDFPQRIIYTNPKKDSIHAWIEGDVEGELKKMNFYFTKKKS